LLDHTTETVAEGLAPGIGLVDPAYAFVVQVLRRSGLAQLRADPTVDAGHQRAGQWSLNIAKQDHAGDVGFVLDPVHVSLVEHHVFTITPGIFLAIDKDAAGIGVGGRQAQVVTQRTGKRVAVRVEVATARQQCKHRTLDVGDAVDQFNGLGAQQFGRGQRLVVPLEVKTLPALFEERAETCVVVLFCGANIALVEQMHGFFANRLPVVLEHIQLREFAAVQIRLGRHTGKQVHQGVVGRKERGVVDELAQHRQPRLATQVHVKDAADKQQYEPCLDGEG